jgi:hypothetical protein
MIATRFLSATALIFTTLILTALAGCGPGGPLPRPEGVQASGKVLLPNGSPLSGGTLILRPDAGIYGATAMIQKDGSFTLSDTSGTADIVPGRYQVFVSFPNPGDAALAKSVNSRYQESDDGDSDVFVDLQQATDELVIKLKR